MHKFTPFVAKPPNALYRAAGTLLSLKMQLDVNVNYGEVYRRKGEQLKDKAAKLYKITQLNYQRIPYYKLDNLEKLNKINNLTESAKSLEKNELIKLRQVVKMHKSDK